MGRTKDVRDVGPHSIHSSDSKFSSKLRSRKVLAQGGRRVLAEAECRPEAQLAALQAGP